MPLPVLQARIGIDQPVSLAWPFPAFLVGSTPFRLHIHQRSQRR